MVGILAAVKFNSLSFIPRCSTNMEQQQNLHLAQAFSRNVLYIYGVEDSLSFNQNEANSIGLF